LNFLKGQLVFGKDFEIQFTPLVFQPKQFLSILLVGMDGRCLFSCYKWVGSDYRMKLFWRV